MPIKRDIYWDSLKFVLIFLVVYGHIAPRFLEGSHFNMAIYNFIYMFHMPLFVFVSGRFSHIRDRERYKNSIFRLFETYVVFQIIRTAFQVLLGGDLTIECLITPQWTLWYLIALIYWRFLVCYLPDEWLKQRKKVIITSVCICLIAGFIPIDYPFVIQRSLSFLPFFVLGYYSFDYDIRKLINKIPLYFSVTLLVIAFLFFFFLLGDKNLESVHTGTFSYWSYGSQYILYLFIARCIFVPLAIILSLLVMRIVPTNSTFAKWGCVTMFIFIYHTFAINFLLELTKRKIIPQNEFLLFVYAVIITVALVFLSRFKLMNYLLNPLSSYRKFFPNR